MLVLFLTGAAIAFRLGQRVPVGPLPEPGRSQTEDLGGEVRSAPRSETIRLDRLRRIAQSNTYLPATLVETDSVIRRWVDREGRPLRVFFQPATARGFTPALGRAARDAFARWSRVGEIPLDFTIVPIPDSAEVTVRWIASFTMLRAGQADLMWRSDGRLQEGTLTLATLSPSGRPLTRDEVFTVALHEIGHLIGLGHSEEPRDVMYPTTSVHDLTTRDRRTAMLLYSLPTGSLKAPEKR